MNWPTEDEIRNFALLRAARIASFAAKAEVILGMIKNAKTIQQIEAEIPGGAKIAEAISRVIPIAHAVAGAIPIVSGLFTLYDVYEGLGGRPKEWGEPNNPEAEARLRDWDRQTNG